VLNSENVVFVDIDEPRIGIWKRLFGSNNLPKKQQMLEMIKQQISRDAYDGLGFRVYETCAGMRLIITGRTFPAGSDESRKILRKFNADPLYAMLCTKQQCYRARLTPKPYRMRLKAHRINYPRTEPEQQSVEQWLETYKRASDRFATYKFVNEFGRPGHNAVIKYHDNVTKARESLALA
jgi:hypothetical protein